MESERIKELYDELANPGQIERRISRNPVRIALPSRGFEIWYEIRKGSVDRNEEHIKKLNEKALKYIFKTRKRDIKKMDFEEELSKPKIDYRVLESNKEQLLIYNDSEIYGFEIGPYRFSSWENPEDELLKNERDTKISNIEKFAEFGNLEFLDLIDYINPGTKLHPKNKGRFSG